MQFSTIFVVLIATPLAVCSRLLVSLPSTAAFPNWNPSALTASTTASLTTISSTYTAPLRSDNTFDFRDVSPGSYLLDVHCSSHVFAPLRVDVSEAGQIESWGTFRGNEWDNKGEVVTVKNLGDLQNLDVKVLGEKSFYVERSGFSPLSLLKNPMILIAGFSMILVFGMPYLMDNMDPEMREEFEARQKTSPLTGGQAAANPLQNFDAAAWLAGSGPKKSELTEKSNVK
ncbi:hypothetical protein BP5796_04674 [Coleophoma crateriformis]|uniref:ER membrane protein complex subunit 7 beta-sandwich domain-containing protein n=1 Tax=Coleophoma crateriformis TaxID=565419 RepID=A0A3D8SA78_9HELO|nr:hypothetical protein BP5796_04674 [Coleophoma crateriformis]